MNSDLLHERLEQLYQQYAKKEFVHPDPLEFLYLYQDTGDREIVGLIASSLAYGRVAQILKSVRKVLDVLGNSPRLFLLETSPSLLEKFFAGFKHRFTTGEEIVAMLLGTRHALKEFGSLNECFVHGLKKSRDEMVEAQCFFTSSITGGGCKNSLVPAPEKDSACKRLNLYFRWMVRDSDVDPGGWNGVPKKGLIVPLDTHMFNICRKLGLTDRNQANLKTALQITENFRKFDPDDPTRYDFPLTRLGIRTDTDLDGFLTSCGVECTTKKQTK
ncbi:MAG TPA: TIGR02757 family protein [Caldisericia bacterium]|nr:TIGR02757 family protein [Caldisericia bacterium]HOU07463.1 TIGR02757 family protein [Caldisericia bacterium]HPL89949.1 TIGR02757 family protein [Caldisericia bacterium]HQG59280.1 TIGR02757 family protein [Caldisericia bacterium]HQH48642.1 TIGR02757 family protein [Caldisericia bacterium]